MEIISLFLGGIFGQLVRSALGIADLLIHNRKEDISLIRLLSTTILGGISGVVIPSLFFYEITNQAIMMAILSGISITYLFENLIKLGQ